MPTAVATLLTVAFVFYLFVRDARINNNASTALWLPVLWLSITGSRFVSQWINLGAPTSSGDEGGVIDVVYFMTLIVGGMIVLVNRRIALGEILRQNRWLIAFLIYSFVSILWSEFPFIAFKRWVKTLGHPVMALIILSDRDAIGAFRIVMKRCAYLLIPFSVLFIKYLPEHGRGFDAWSGEAVNRGVGLTKNDLGYVSMVLGIFFLWNVLTQWKTNVASWRRSELLLSFLFLALIVWLLNTANSATSLAAFVLGALTLVVLGFGFVSKRSLGTFVLASLLIVAGAQAAFDLYAEVLRLLGRDPSLTDRTALWADALALHDSPMLGVGFESFWLGYRLDVLWSKWWWQPNQVHNGYLETYLNLGMVGVVLLLGIIVSTFRTIRGKLITEFDFARLRLAFLFAILAFNYTEAAFKAVHFVWTIFYIIAIDYPKPHRAIQPYRRKATMQRVRLREPKGRTS